MTGPKLRRIGGLMTRIITTFVLLLSSAAVADEPKILSVNAEKSGMGWNISVEISHPDTGWDHFSDKWEILDIEGKVLATRDLSHPHVTEQPFTRTVSNVMLPDGTRIIHVRAHCSRDDHTYEAYPFRIIP